MNDVSVGLLPLTIQCDANANDFIAHYNSNKKKYDGLLEKNGAIKFTNVDISSVDDFQSIVNSISTKFINYIDGNSPRTKLSQHVYTSTEYDKTQRITMHNELSYSAKWPGKLFFTCIVPAETGGETLLADSRLIVQRMNSKLVSEIRSKGIMYIRNLHGGKGIGPSWQDTFETKEKVEVEAFCRSNGIEFQWVNGDMLRLKQKSQGIIRHRKTGEELWFNQIDQFHPYQLGEEMYDTLKMMYDTPENFPTYVSFGDGTKIQESVIDEILNTIREVTIDPLWRKNELMVVDNELVAHGRNSYTGDRKVLVAMSE